MVYIPPVVAFPRRLGVSITGGYVYRGHPGSSYDGVYICGDFETRRIWGIKQKDRKLQRILEIGLAPAKISSFGQDSAGQIYLVGYDGVIYSMDLARAIFEPSNGE
jgi:hypothetical protein